MADPQVLGDYDPELVTLTLSAIKSGVEITPQQFGPESRITVPGLARAESVEGMGGTVIRSRLHTTLTTLGFTLMPTDPAVKQISDLVDEGEIFKFSIVDNSATDSSVEGKCWVETGMDYTRNRTAEAIVCAFQAQVPRKAMRHGQMVLP